MRMILASVVTIMLFATTSATADGYEVPQDEAPAASLPANQIASSSFHVVDPVHSDGLMRQYMVDCRFGTFPAYGKVSLTLRLHQLAALEELSKVTDVDVVARAVRRDVESDVNTVTGAVSNPIGTVVGVPKGIGHLFRGFVAQGKELTAHAGQPEGPGSKTNVGEKVQSDARRYADRYLGVSAAERRWYQQVGVDPYTNNEVLRRTVHHLAKVDATANLSLKFAGPPGIPFAGELRRTMDAI